MATININSTWQEVVDTNQEYLMQLTSTGSYFIKLSTAQPTDASGVFKLTHSDTLSSIILPANKKIWAKTVQSEQLTVETW